MVEEGRAMKAWKPAVILLLAAFVAVFLLAAISTAARAEEPASWPAACGPVGSKMAIGEAKYGAVPTSAGIAGIGGIALGVLLLNKETGSWAFLVRLPNAGMECILASGEDWRELDPQRRGSH